VIILGWLGFSKKTKTSAWKHTIKDLNNSWQDIPLKPEKQEQALRDIANGNEALIELFKACKKSNIHFISLSAKEGRDNTIAFRAEHQSFCMVDGLFVQDGVSFEFSKSSASGAVCVLRIDKEHTDRIYNLLAENLQKSCGRLQNEELLSRMLNLSSNEQTITAIGNWGIYEHEAGTSIKGNDDYKIVFQNDLQRIIDRNNNELEETRDIIKTGSAVEGNHKGQKSIDNLYFS